MEDNKQNKSRFIVQYWGTKTLYVGGVGLVEVGNVGWNLRHPDFFLQLTDLKDIKDEDSIQVAKIMGIEEDHLFMGKVICNCIFDNSASMAETTIYNMHSEATDYLRSKGYILPFNGLSTEEIINRGWAKTK